MCTRSSNHVDTLDIYRFQLLQLIRVAHLLVVDVNFRLALGQHLELTVLALYHRYHRQQVVGSTDIMKQRMLHVDRHTAQCRLVLRNFAFDLNALYHIGLGVKGDSADVAYADVSGNGLIAYIRHF